jgi:hypothetical protein
LSIGARILEKSPPFLERQGLGPTRRVDAYNGQPGASLRPPDAEFSTEHEWELFATGLEERCDKVEEGR